MHNCTQFEGYMNISCIIFEKFFILLSFFFFSFFIFENDIPILLLNQENKIDCSNKTISHIHLEISSNNITYIASNISPLIG
jgi:hypothetical protein